ncbi:MAG: TonB-dependent receptor [Alistipes sp.]|nr:TonB-dependent receptor [Alistipes sp.]
MRRFFTILFVVFAAYTAKAQTTENWIDDGLSIPEVAVLGEKPMKDIGSQKTTFSESVLKESIALSMADVLTFNSSIFVKSYGRATLSTVSFRGTSPAHTQVSWNGLRINSPMLGMTDFSMIPSYFIDEASLLHGTSSVNDTGGGLGGSVRLATKPLQADGFGMQYIQGVGSFRTFDEFLRLTYGSRKWQFSTRAAYSSSPNDFKYRNRDKRENIYDEDKNIIGRYYPIERNRSGAYKDLHILQEISFNAGRGDSFALKAWYVDSNRELAMLTTDYGDEGDFDNRQREHTLRSVLEWNHLRHNWKVGAKAGYVYSWTAYDFKRDPGNGIMEVMTRSRSLTNTLFGQAEGEYYIGNKWLFTANLTAHQHFVESRDKNIIRQDGNKAIVGYDQSRVELSGAVSAKWRPYEKLGLSLIVREEMYGEEFSPIIPAFFAEYELSRQGNIILKGSVSRNFRFPTLNDLYFLPGGNPDLKKERGWTYDAGVSFAVGKSDVYTLSGSASWFDSYVKDWILWLATPKGFLSPRNVKQVHAYGVELKADLAVAFNRHWKFDASGTFSWTPSINEGEPMTEADKSVGKQLPYIPQLSSTLSARLMWRRWAFHYKWCYYSQRYTMSSNDISLTGRLPDYYMSNISLEKGFSLPWADLSVKGSINNLFDEEYISVLSRPMPGINFEIFLGITPKWGKR